jgi:hypothetical protein
MEDEAGSCIEAQIIIDKYDFERAVNKKIRIMLPLQS